MGTRKLAESVTLDQLTVQRLPDQLIKEISEARLEEIKQWETSTLAIRIVSAKGNIFIDSRTRVRIPVKRALAILTSITGTIWVAATYIFPHLDALQPIIGRLISGH